MGIEPLELDSGVFGCELPIGLGAVLVSMALPSGDFFFQSRLVGNASAQALARQNGELGFGHVDNPPVTTTNTSATAWPIYS
jgi:hypothetical protein